MDPLTRQVDLHIGVEKTGTSTLQAALHAEREHLLDAGVLYPTSLGTGNHMALAVIGRDDDVVDDLRRRRRLLTPAAVQRFRDEKRAALRKEVAAAGVDRVVLSNEHCSSRLTSEREVRRLVDWLEATIGAEVEVHVYLRRQDDMVESRHSTAVRYGGAEELQLPGEQELRTLYDYESLLDRWAAVLGDDRLHPRLFVRDRLRDGDVVADFTGRLGLPRVTSAASGEVNTALDGPTQVFAALLNRHVPRFTEDGPSPLHAQVLRALDAAESTSGPQRLAPDDAQRLMERLRSSNDAVAERWFSGAPLFEEETTAREDSEPLDVERCVALAGHVLIHVVEDLEASHERQLAASHRRQRELQDEVEQLRSKVKANGGAGSSRAWWPRLRRALRHPVWTLRRRRG